MGEELLKKFGRYFLLDRIAQGGMAEIYRARLATAEGAGRILVIKRIQSGFNGNSEFLQMFKSEIKVTMGFNHPNIVQLYDFGDEEGMPYIAMEYVDGKNARQFAVQFEKTKQRLAIELAAYIIEQAASGLYYAHSYRDKITGEPLNVVHRDISPQNILVSYDGNVKVIDFGIAKATTNSEATKAGVIKGKPSYLAPEQITGEDLDGRCDIFALGICLWELLVGRKLFSAPGENEYAVLKLVESCQTYVKPPSQFNPAVHKDLDMIVMKALQKRREDRYQNAEDFQKALKRFIFTHYPEFNPSDLSYWGKNLFKDEIVNDKKDLQRLNAKAEQLLQLELDEDGVTLPTDEISGPVYARKEEKTFESSELTGTATVPGATMPTPPKLEIEKSEPEKGQKRVAKKSAPSLASSGIPGTASSPQAPSVAIAQPTRTVHTGKRERPKREKSGSNAGRWIAAAIALVVAGGTGALYLSHKGAADRSVAGTENLATDTTSETKPAAKESSSQKISLNLNIFPSAEGAKITLNDKVVDASTLKAQIQPDTPLELVIDKTGYRPLRREFVVQSAQLGELKEWVIDVTLEPLNYGYLTLRSTPYADAAFYKVDSAGRVVASDKKPWAVIKTDRMPLVEVKFPVGSYQVRLDNKLLGMGKTVNVEVNEGRVVSIEERLEIIK